MSIGIWQLLLILVIVFVVFGAGKLPRVMGDIGKGVRSLRDGLKGDEAASQKEIASDRAETIVEAVDEHDRKQG